MWKSSVRGIFLSQTRFSFSNNQNDEKIFLDVLSMLDNLAWFHRTPVLILATTTTILCIIRHGKGLDKLDQEKRQRFIKNISMLPFWNLFLKLICSIALLQYFDHHRLTKDTKVASLRS